MIYKQTLAVERTHDLEVVGAVVEVGDDLLDLCNAVGGNFGSNLPHHAASAAERPGVGTMPVQLTLARTRNTTINGRIP